LQEPCNTGEQNMNQLKINSLLLVGTPIEKQYFENYFREVTLLMSNSEVLNLYNNNLYSTIFLDFDANTQSAVEICKKIREHDHKTIIVFLARTLNNNYLQQLLPLHLSGYIKRPLDNDQIKEVLFNIEQDLEFLSENTVRLEQGYHFHIQESVLHNPLHNEIKLTKNELKLLSILINYKDKLVTEEIIEHEIWEEQSLELDCSNRLKNLLYNLRKKLPKNSISNNYRLGYKLVQI